MGLKIGEVDIYQQLLNNEYEIQRLIGAINILLDKMNVDFTNEEIAQMNKEALEFLRQKYPNSDIRYLNEVQNDDAK